MANDLPVGTSRTGFMFDGDPRTPPTAVTLKHDEGRIQLSVPWNRNDDSQAYGRWFLDAHWGDDRDQSRFSYQVPHELLFQDGHGPVVLVGCRRAGMQTNPVAGLGTGVVTADYAVLGGQLGYSRVDGLRSELAGLGDWMGLRSLSRDDTFTPGTSPQGPRTFRSSRLVLEAPPAVRISRRLNLHITPDFSILQGQDPDVTQITERMVVQTLVGRPREWDEHMDIHRAIRDLISISNWRLAPFKRHDAMRRSDSLLFPTRQPSPQWFSVQTQFAQPPQSPGRQRAQYLFTFQDVGTTGVDRWLRLRSRFGRAIDPTLSTIFRTEVSALTRVAEVGIGLEALGYLLALEAGVSPRRAGRESHESRLRRIASDVSTWPLAKTPSEWAQDSAATYNGIKHANRRAPEVVDALNSWRECVLVFRVWVAGRLGAPTEILSQNLTNDSMRHEYRAI